MNAIKEALNTSPEILLFLSVALGYAIGKIPFGKFQLGGVAGSLLVAVVLSQLGVHIDNGIKAVLFALFIYAVGFDSGPQFFRSLGRQSLREIAMAAVLALSGLATVVVLARLAGLDKGLAAGVAAGALTQSAVIGTAGAALAKLGLAPGELQRLQGNVAIGYAVTYIFGSLGAIILCVNVLPKFMGRSIRDDALKAEAAQNAGLHLLAEGEAPALPDLVGRLFRIGEGAGAGRTVSELEAGTQATGPITVERIRRDKQVMLAQPDLVLSSGDVVLIVGRRAGVLAAARQLGPEQPATPDMDLVLVSRDVTIGNHALVGKTFGEIQAGMQQRIRHGIYVTHFTRMGQAVPLKAGTKAAAGDVVTLFGTAEDVQRVAQIVGVSLQPSDKTDFVFHGLGIAVGLVIGLAVVRVGSVPLTLGSGGGALLSGLLFGWWRARHQNVGNLPSGAGAFLRDFGLAGFVAAVGLQSGLQAVETVRASGVSIFLIGVAVTIIPLVVTMLFGRYVLHYDNTAVLAGALSGARSANPAFGEVLNKAGNAIPTVPFAITYALANVFLTLLGPLVVALA
ncbi:aspartate-alanine antiporter [Corticibacter populi]|uniref:Aspartate-alanine antiporter n=1 Tax=Corticibacter populi TaxID=1550736 RepID=A0A3M6QU43_9BURK|nr:aspartate-alanine antiporter [Corticibacter populi]RMX06554.1 aspartate-alanine antiporter [Corticibacter populi]RZS31881.1 aspartate-alanine antiporter [Corticibacter populi]